MRGLKRLPGDTAEKLVIRSFHGWGVGSTLRGALSALRRLDGWLGSKFGCVYSFEAEPALVGWFLMGNLVNGEDDGHASRSLVAGLRFAADTRPKSRMSQ